MPEKILVVDDEQEIPDLVELYLQNENYEVFKFYSAKDALACMESTELDLAILDIMLPEVNGFALRKDFLTGICGNCNTDGRNQNGYAPQRTGPSERGGTKE